MCVIPILKLEGNPLTDMGDYTEYDKRILDVVKSDWPDYDLSICEFPWA